MVGMDNGRAFARQEFSFSEAIARQIRERSAAGSPDARELAENLSADVASDIVHFLAALHGRYPTIVDLASRKLIDDEAREWLVKSVDGFAREREYLARLTPAVGPMASTVGGEEANAALPHIAHAFAMLAGSDRSGCAEGTCIAFMIDWTHIRGILDRIARELELPQFPCSLPDEASSLELADRLAVSTARRRAMAFGIEQYLDQKQGLWRLLATRRRARLG